MRSVDMINVNDRQFATIRVYYYLLSAVIRKMKPPRG